MHNMYVDFCDYCVTVERMSS